MLKELLLFAKHPVYEPDTTIVITEKFNILFKLLILALCSSIVLLMVASAFENILQLNVGKHAMDDLFKNYSVGIIFCLAVLVAPFFEELLFRGPLVFFKDSTYFKFAFYIITIAFGFMHISNFDLNAQVLLFSPLLVAPQISVGFLLGFIRVKFGLVWSIALHACYNMALMGPVLVIKFLDIPIE